MFNTTTPSGRGASYPSYSATGAIMPHRGIVSGSSSAELGFGVGRAARQVVGGLATEADSWLRYLVLGNSTPRYAVSRDGRRISLPPKQTPSVLSRVWHAVVGAASGFGVLPGADAAPIFPIFRSFSVSEGNVVQITDAQVIFVKGYQYHPKESNTINDDILQTIYTAYEGLGKGRLVRVVVLMEGVPEEDTTIISSRGNVCIVQRGFDSVGDRSHLELMQGYLNVGFESVIVLTPHSFTIAARDFLSAHRHLVFSPRRPDPSPDEL